MHFGRKKLASKFILKLVFTNGIILFFIYSYIEHKYSERYGSEEFYFENFEKVYLNSYCKCRKRVFVEQHKFFENFYRKGEYYFLFENDVENKTLNAINKYQILQKRQFFLNPRFTCDLNHVFDHGPNVKVLSFSLYGQRIGYSYLLENIVNQARSLYKGWMIRIYYNNSINKTIICDLECKYDNVFFCNVNHVPIKYQSNINMLKLDEKGMRTIAISNNLSYVNGMMWRWFPISDDFVDIFSSRDTDSTIIQREKDSVDVWLKSNNLFHIMREFDFKI